VPGLFAAASWSAALLRRFGRFTRVRIRQLLRAGTPALPYLLSLANLSGGT